MRSFFRSLLSVAFFTAALAALLMAGYAFADAPAPAGVPPAVANASSALTAWLSLLLPVIAALYGIYQKALSPRVHAKLDAEAADSHASAFAQRSAQFGGTILTLVESQAGHVFEDEQRGEKSGLTPQESLTQATSDLLNGLGDAGKGLATQYLGVGGAALYDVVEGLIKSQVQAKRNAAVAAGAQAAALAVPKGPPSVAGPAALAAI